MLNKYFELSAKQKRSFYIKLIAIVLSILIPIFFISFYFKTYFLAPISFWIVLSVIASFFDMPSMIKNEKEYQARLEKGWAEQRIREEKEAKIKAKRDAELKKLKNLINQSEQWHKVQKFRAYIDHLEELNSKDFSLERDQLISWAREKADWMDPLKEKEIDIFKELDKNILI